MTLCSTQVTHTEAVLCSITAPSPALMSKHPRGARGFLGLQQDLLVATACDPLASNYTKWEPNYEPGVRLTVHSGPSHILLAQPDLTARLHHMLSLQSHAGLATLTPSSYCDLIGSLQPDLYIALGDEVGASARPKRVRSSVDRTLRWLDASIAQHAQQQLPGPAPCAPIMGGSCPEQRARSAALSAQRQVAGKTPFCTLPKHIL